MSLDAEIALTAGPTRLSHEASREAFMDQARAYQDADALDNVGKAVLFALWGKQFTHPMPVHRAQELERWVLAGGYDGVLRKTEKAAAAQSPGPLLVFPRRRSLDR